jgi:hypothetical protein
MLLTVKYVTPEYGEAKALAVSKNLEPDAVVALTVQPEVFFAIHVNTLKLPGSTVTGDA